jgi:competence protein ComEA
MSVTPSSRRELIVTLLLLVVIGGAALYFLRPAPPPVIPKLETTKITVSIAGEVVRPGVYTLEFGSRVQALVDAAGGYSATAEPSLVNPVQILTDGDQIRVPNKLALSSPEGPNGKTATPQARVNVNTATAAQLEDLPGVGEKLAERIIQGRPYASLADLDKIKGVGESMLKRLEGLVRF